LEASAVSAAAQKPMRENGNLNEGDGVESLGPLSHVDLRGNSLAGSIVLADYGVSFLFSKPIHPSFNLFTLIDFALCNKQI